MTAAEPPPVTNPVAGEPITAIERSRLARNGRVRPLRRSVIPFSAIRSAASGWVASAAGEHLDGIVGYNFLNGFAVTIDYPGERLRLA